MDYLIKTEHWSALVRDLKDSEKEYDVSAYDTEELAQCILRYARTTRFRQYALFTQQRGKEYEDMIAELQKRFTPEAITRVLAEDEFWKATLALV